MTVQQAFDLALQHHQAGRLAEADALYRQILAVQPNHIEALHYLGVVAHKVGRPELAVDIICQAISLNPLNPAAYSSLAAAQHALGRLEDAIASYRQALRLKPDDAAAQYNLGNALYEAGRLDDAVAALRRALELKPDYAHAHVNLAIALGGQGKLREAAEACRQALRLQPDLPEAHINLGVALAELGQADEARAAYARALQLQPGLPEAHNNLANTLRAQGHLEEALAEYRQALAFKPDYLEAHVNLAIALNECARPDEATVVCRRALQLKADYPEALNTLGTALGERWKLDEAAAAYRRALELKPGYAEAWNNLGNVLKDQGSLDEAVTAYRRALDLHPGNAGWHSNLVYTLHFQPRQSDQAILEEQGRWNRQFSEPVRRCLRTHDNDRSTGRRLRVGYVSPDFWGHVICHFFTPLLEAHDRSQCEIFCYASVQRPDAITGRIKKSADVWRDVRGLGDEPLAALIRQDGIDILVDLTQHMADNRLLVFAGKPAPVQVGWLGYPASTGLPTMDYRFTDAFLEPVDSTWSKSVETPVRLPDSWFCFDPIDAYPEPGPLPALTAGHVTFGSLNNFCKINEVVLLLWAQVLQSVDGSRLLMQCPAGSTQARVRQWFEARGIAAHRLELVSRTARREEFLQLFGRIDLALETFPYNGGTTTCEALWMGIPVPTFPGSSAVSRIGLSILSAAGLHELIAAGQEEYLRLTVGLAADLPQLGEWRSTLRQRMKTSAFMDAPRFARGVEAAYRTMWRQWCGHGA